MNPAIASLSEKWQVRGPQDGPAATIHSFDETGTYVNRVMKISDVPAFIEEEWERQASHAARPVDW